MGPKPIKMLVTAEKAHTATVVLRGPIESMTEPAATLPIVGRRADQAEEIHGVVRAPLERLDANQALLRDAELIFLMGGSAHVPTSQVKSVRPHASAERSWSIRAYSRSTVPDWTVPRDRCKQNAQASKDVACALLITDSSFMGSTGRDACNACPAPC